MKTNETFKQQVNRVLNEMVKSGEVVTKKNSAGVTLYGLPSKKTTKTKFKVSKKIAKKRRMAALKAWETRRKMAAVKLKTTKVTKCSKWEVRSAAAKKAWVTRKAKSYVLAGTTTGLYKNCSGTMSTSCTKSKFKRTDGLEFTRPIHGALQEYLQKAVTSGSESIEAIKKALLAVGII